MLAKVIEKVLLQWLISTLSRELFYFVGINFFRIRTITWHVRLFSFDIAVRFVITITRKTWSTIIDKKGNQLFSICFLNFWNYMDYFRIRDGNLEIEKKNMWYMKMKAPNLDTWLFKLVGKISCMSGQNHERGDPLIFRKILST